MPLTTILIRVFCFLCFLLIFFYAFSRTDIFFLLLLSYLTFLLSPAFRILGGWMCLCLPVQVDASLKQPFYLRGYLAAAMISVTKGLPFGLHNVAR